MNLIGLFLKESYGIHGSRITELVGGVDEV